MLDVNAPLHRHTRCHTVLLDRLLPVTQARAADITDKQPMHYASNIDREKLASAKHSRRNFQTAWSCMN